MKENKILIFFCLFIFSLSQYELDIVEGTKSFTIDKATFFNFTFNSTDSGTYIIIFPEEFELKEATGDIHEDINIESYNSSVYVQKFAKGDIVKVKYPKSNTVSKTTDIKIRIEKIDAYFKLKTAFDPIIFTMAVNDCQKPVYIFTGDTSYSYYFHGKVHSGEFTGSYRNTEFDPDYPLDKDFNDLSISSGTELPCKLNFNIVKLQCKDPGIISIYIGTIGSYRPLNTIGLCILLFPNHYNEIFSSDQLPIKGYYQRFNLVGNTAIDFSSIRGKKYSSDFYIKLSISSILIDIGFSISRPVTMTLTSFNKGESTDKVAVEK